MRPPDSGQRSEMIMEVATKSSLSLPAPAPGPAAPASVPVTARRTAAPAAARSSGGAIMPRTLGAQSGVLELVHQERY